MVEMQNRQVPFTLLGIAFGDDYEKVKQMAIDESLNFPVLFVPENQINQLNPFGVESVPTTMIVRTDGKIEKVAHGPMDKTILLLADELKQAGK